MVSGPPAHKKIPMFQYGLHATQVQKAVVLVLKFVEFNRVHDWNLLWRAWHQSAPRTRAAWPFAARVRKNWVLLMLMTATSYQDSRHVKRHFWRRFAASVEVRDAKLHWRLHVPRFEELFK